MTMPPEQSDLVDRLRRILAEETVREIAMFGGRSFMVDERLAVSALKSGGLLVRIDADRHEELLGRLGAAQAEMGAGRTMGPGWIEFDAAAITEDAGPESWVALALEHNRASAGDVR